jgi:hypothetical protein
LKPKGNSTIAWGCQEFATGELAEGEELGSNVLSQNFATLRASPTRPTLRVCRRFSVKGRRMALVEFSKGRRLHRKQLMRFNIDSRFGM